MSDKDGCIKTDDLINLMRNIANTVEFGYAEVEEFIDEVEKRLKDNN